MDTFLQEQCSDWQDRDESVLHTYERSQTDQPSLSLIAQASCPLENHRTYAQHQ